MCLYSKCLLWDRNVHSSEREFSSIIHMLIEPEGKKFTLKVNDKIVFFDGDNTVTISKNKQNLYKKRSVH